MRAAELLVAREKAAELLSADVDMEVDEAARLDREKFHPDQRGGRSWQENLWERFRVTDSITIGAIHHVRDGATLWLNEQERSRRAAHLRLRTSKGGPHLVLTSLLALTGRCLWLCQRLVRSSCGHKKIRHIVLTRERRSSQADAGATSGEADIESPRASSMAQGLLTVFAQGRPQTKMAE